MITDNDDIIDVRDVIERVEDLEASRGTYDGFHNTPGAWAEIDDGEPEELQALLDLLAVLAGAGGDHEWRGAWYPVTLVRDGYFETYAKELAEDCGLIKRDAGWPLAYVDWEKAANALQQDYSQVDFGESTYWYR